MLKQRRPKAANSPLRIHFYEDVILVGGGWAKNGEIKHAN